MKKFSVLIVIIGLIAIAWIPNSQADEITLQDVFNNITAPYPGVSSINVVTDRIPDGSDAYWQISASGGSVATIIVELAGNANFNSFGVYDQATPSKIVQIFSGLDSAGEQATLSIRIGGKVYINNNYTGIDFAGNSFGYYMQSPIALDNNVPIGFNTFFSDTLLNSDRYDHMWAYQGKGIDTVQLPGFLPGPWGTNEYALAFEDTYGGGDGDHQDFVVMVESVSPTVPEPGTLILMGSGLLGLAGYARIRLANRKKKF